MRSLTPIKFSRILFKAKLSADFGVYISDRQSSLGVLIPLSVSDLEVVRLCKRNRKEGYELLFGRFQRYIYSVCYGYAGRREEALDLTQEVFLKIYRAMPSFEEGRAMLPWIKRITVNTCLNHQRQQGPPEVELLDSHEADARSDPEEPLVRQQDHRALQAAIRQLPDRERMAMVLRHIKGLSYEEVAMMMSCPLGTVKTYLFRGRRMLRQTLRENGVWGDNV